MLGFKFPFYPAPTLLLSCGLSLRVLWHLIMTRPHVIHASSPGAAAVWICCRVRGAAAGCRLSCCQQAVFRAAT